MFKNSAYWVKLVERHKGLVKDLMGQLFSHAYCWLLA